MTVLEAVVNFVADIFFATSSGSSAFGEKGFSEEMKNPPARAEIKYGIKEILIVILVILGGVFATAFFIS